MMHLKRYTIASLIWMALVAWYVYAYVTTDNLSLNIFGKELPSLSIALLVVAPVFVLYVTSLFHMWFHSFLHSFKDRKYEKDYEKLIDAIIDAYLGKANRHYEFKTERYKLLGKLLENTALIPSGELKGIVNDERIDKILELLEKIKNSEVVDLKPYNLKPENALVIQNYKNMYNKGELDAETILANPSKYAESLAKDVYVDFVKIASLEEIEKYKQYMTKESLNGIFSRINADENTLDIPNEKLIELINMLELSKEDFIVISKTLSKSGMIPEQRMRLFEMLSEEREEAMDAYLYTLFDLEMLSLANEILDNASSDEYPNFRAYRALKECGKNFNIEMFV